MKKPLPESFLPLKPHWFHVLLSLSNQDQHGYGIMQEVLDRTARVICAWGNNHALQYAAPLAGGGFD